MRGVIDRKGEQFAYIEGDVLYTLDGDPSGHLREGYIVDLAGNRKWRLVGDAICTLDGSETIGYMSDPRPSDYEL